MELDKFNELRNCIIKNTIKKITLKYKITQGNNIITSEQLEKDLLIKNKCIGVIITNNNAHQCSKKSLPNENYCNSHYYKKKHYQESQESQESQEVNINNCTKRLIDNTFYYINNNCIYDCNGIKVGIVRNERYILSDDPYILNLI